MIEYRSEKKNPVDDPSRRSDYEFEKSDAQTIVVENLKSIKTKNLMMMHDIKHVQKIHTIFQLYIQILMTNENCQFHISSKIIDEKNEQSLNSFFEHKSNTNARKIIFKKKNLLNNN